MQFFDAAAAAAAAVPHFIEWNVLQIIYNNNRRFRCILSALLREYVALCEPHARVCGNDCRCALAANLWRAARFTPIIRRLYDIIYIVSV